MTPIPTEAASEPPISPLSGRPASPPALIDAYECNNNKSAGSDDDDDEASGAGRAAGGEVKGGDTGSPCYSPRAVFEPAAARVFDHRAAPCSHNDWDDVRTRKGAKVLRCRQCEQQWKLPSGRVPRCLPFLHGECELPGSACPYIHVHKKKVPLSERKERFTDAPPRPPACDATGRHIYADPPQKPPPLLNPEQTPEQAAEKRKEHKREQKKRRRASGVARNPPSSPPEAAVAGLMSPPRLMTGTPMQHAVAQLYARDAAPPTLPPAVLASPPPALLAGAHNFDRA